MNPLNRVSGQQEQVQRYAPTLAEQEGKLAAPRDTQSQLSRRRATLKSEISVLIDKMEF
jgi:hypothetical protein